MRPALAVTALLALGACSEEGVDRLAPTDRFYYPIGVATTSAGAGSALLVASSNFDLRYSAEEGGTLLSVDPYASARAAALGAPATPVDPLGVQRLPSYAGPVVAVDARSCPALAATPSALVASRYDDVLYRFGIDPATGALACGAGCRTDLGGGRPGAPFAIAVACGAGFQRAYVGFLDTPDTARSVGDSTWVAELDLSGAAPPRIFEIGDGPARSLAFEPAGNRLWVAARSSRQRALLHAAVVTSARWQAEPLEAVGSLNLQAVAPDAWGGRGIELKSIAVGTPGPAATRLYAAARLYDPEAELENDARPSGSIGSRLLILDVDYGPEGWPVLAGLEWRDLVGLDVGEIAVVRRAGGADVVLAAVADLDAVAVYDDANRQVELASWDDPVYGVPTLGDRPVALAVDQPNPGDDATVYVAAFGDDLVNRFRLSFDPVTPSSAPSLGALEAIGGLAP